MAEYAVKVESGRTGNVLILRAGFSSREAAETYPVQFEDWKRVWVERVESSYELGALPWRIERGPKGAMTVHDAVGHRILALTGTRAQRDAVAAMLEKMLGDTAGRF